MPARIRRAAARWKEAEEASSSPWSGSRTTSQSGPILAEGSYWDGEVNICGVVSGAVIEGEEGYLRVRELALNHRRCWSTSRALRKENVCGAKVWRDGLMHVSRLRRATGGREDWTDNLGAPPVGRVEGDENVELRREAEAARRELEEKERGVGKNSRGEEGCKEDKEEKEEGRQESEGLRWEEGLSDHLRGDRFGPLTGHQEGCGSEGKEGEKTRKKSSSSSEVLVESELFEGQPESQKIWRRTPGALALGTVLEAQQTFLSRQGVHPDVHRNPLPP